MSVFLLSESWRIKDISPTQKLVLISLSDQANDHGVCWPSVAHMQQRTCLSERAIRSAINQLAELGYLEKTERTGRSTYYTVTPAPRAPLHHVHPTPAGDAPLPLQEVHPTPAPRAPITIKEPSLEPKRKQKEYIDQNDLIQAGIDETIARDFLIGRKKKLTETALRAIVREAGIAGLTVEQALKISAERQWQSFKAEWVMDKQGRKISFFELATGQRPEF